MRCLWHRVSYGEDTVLCSVSGWQSPPKPVSAKCLCPDHCRLMGWPGRGDRELTCMCLCRGAWGFGCRGSRSPWQGSRLPHHCEARSLVMSVEALGRLAALLLKLLTTTHSETLVFVFHIFSKTSFRQSFHALGRFFLSQNIKVLLFVRTRLRVNNPLVSKAKKG